MYIVAIAWLFVVLLMTAAEATSTQGSLLGALITLLLYGILPLSIVLYVMGTPARRQARIRAEQAELAAAWRPVTRSRRNEKNLDGSLNVHHCPPPTTCTPMRAKRQRARPAKSANHLPAVG